MNERLRNLKFIADDIEYEIGMDIDQVKGLSTYSNSKDGKIGDADVFKFALKANNGLSFITQDRLKNILLAIYENDGITFGGDVYSYEEIFGYIVGLAVQTLNDEAEKYKDNPAIITINEDKSVNVIVNDKEYKLEYNRSSIEKKVIKYGELPSQNNILEFYTFCNTLIKSALKHNHKDVSSKIVEEIFMSMFANTLEENTKSDFFDAMESLVALMAEVLDSVAKKSTAAIRSVDN